MNNNIQAPVTHRTVSAQRATSVSIKRVRIYYDPATDTHRFSTRLYTADVEAFLAPDADGEYHLYDGPSENDADITMMNDGDIII